MRPPLVHSGLAIYPPCGHHLHVMRRTTMPFLAVAGEVLHTVFIAPVQHEPSELLATTIDGALYHHWRWVHKLQVVQQVFIGLSVVFLIINHPLPLHRITSTDAVGNAIQEKVWEWDLVVVLPPLEGELDIPQVPAGEDGCLVQGAPFLLQVLLRCIPVVDGGATDLGGEEVLNVYIEQGGKKQLGEV
jgi:hypothetical protein